MNTPQINDFSSISAVLKQLRSQRYIADDLLATVVFLSYQLGKPIFLEGEPSVGKTEIAIALSKVFHTRLIRLQCYEGLGCRICFV